MPQSVNRLRYELFAGAGFAYYQNRIAATARDEFDHLERTEHRLALADHGYRTGDILGEKSPSVFFGFCCRNAINLRAVYADNVRFVYYPVYNLLHAIVVFTSLQISISSGLYEFVGRRD